MSASRIQTPVRAILMEQPRQAGLRDFARPVIGDDDGLLRVELAGVCGTDLKIYHGLYTGKVGLPLIPGHEICGVIEEIGEKAAARWGVEVGSRVAVDSFLTCGLCEACMAGNSRYCSTMGDYGVSMPASLAPHLWGGFSEHVYLSPGAQVHPLPDGCSMELGILVPAVISNALRWVGDIGGVAIGSRVLIQGPGPIGLASVVVAKALGAELVVVSGLASDTKRLAMADRLGADQTLVVGPDLCGGVLELTGGEGVDVVIEVSGSVLAIAAAPSMVRRQGTIVLAGLSGGKAAEISGDEIALKEITINGVFSHDRSAVLRALQFVDRMPQMFDDFITHRYPLAETVDAIEVVGAAETDLVKSVVVPTE